MTGRVVLRMGHPVLMQVAEPVTETGTERLHQLVADMWDTMAEYGGIGLAAPQIGVSERLVVFGVQDQEERAPEVAIAPTVLINPVITALDDSLEHGWEGCLSVPGMRGLVPRHARIRYTGIDENGNIIDREVEGYHARVVQHECDHLDGVLYPQRMDDLTQFGFEPEMTERLLGALAQEASADNTCKTPGEN